MSNGLNKVLIIGRLGADPETKQMPNGKAVTNLRIATSEKWKDKSTGDMQERTEWHSVVMFERLAEIAGEYLRKGSQVYVEGSLRTRKWQDKETGKDRYTTEIVGRELQMLGSKAERPAGVGESNSGFDMKQAERDATLPEGKTTAGVPDEQFDDDIPFN